jgi:diphthamide synthase subunit DPH2
LRLPNGREIVMENANPQKLFNYYVQCLETVNNTKKLIALKELFKGKKSKVVLVVYDSILIDYSAEDGKGFLKQIKDLLEEEGYRVKAKKGDNYNF